MATYMREIPNLSTVLSAYASVSALIMVFRTILNEMIPQQRAVEVYLPTIASPNTNSLLIGSNDARDAMSAPKLGVPVGTKVIDNFQGMRLEWTLECQEESKKYYHQEKKSFTLTCKKNVKDRVLANYFPHISKTAQAIFNKRESLNIYTYDKDSAWWESTIFKHPSTFDTLAMDSELKQFIKDDLDLFVSRKGFFDKVGRAWKRGYLLYGPPGTGKSSLVAAIANYMRYNIYDLQFQSVKSDADLRNVLTSTTNRSIILIEDIDCSAKVSHVRHQVSDMDSDEKDDQKTEKLFMDPGATLSGLLNFIDGLWSSCGEERIIIFTTNHKDRLDPALLRPGRMDVHIEMGYCTREGFRKLAETYLDIQKHDLFETIEDLIKQIEITPAQVAQHLMKSDNPKIALESLLEFLNMKKNEKEKEAQEEEGKIEKQKDAKKEKECGKDVKKEKECGKDVKKEKVCQKCGKDMKKEKERQKCGKDVNKETQCQKCGKDVKQEKECQKCRKDAKKEKECLKDVKEEKGEKDVKEEKECQKCRKDVKEEKGEKDVKEEKECEKDVKEEE